MRLVSLGMSLGTLTAAFLIGIELGRIHWRPLRDVECPA